MTNIPEGLHLYQLTMDRVAGLWNKVKSYDRLFSDETRGNMEGFTKHLLDRRTVVLETDDLQALLFLSDIHEGLSAEVHAIMFDHHLSSRTELVRNALVWAMLEFDLYRLQACIPNDSASLQRWLRKLGFKVEGILRNHFWYQGCLAASTMMSLVREEVL